MSRRAQLEDLVADSVAPLALLDVGRRRLRAANARFVETLGRDGDLTGVHMDDLVAVPAQAQQWLASLSCGEVDAVESTRLVHAGHRAVTSRLALVDEGPPPLALWSLSGGPRGAPGTDPLVPGEPWWDGAVGGVLDADLCVARISHGIEDYFGFRADEVIGRPGLSFVHPDDAAAFLQTAAEALSQRVGAATTLRIRNHAEQWQPMHAVFVPLDTQPVVLTYTLMPADAAHPDEERLDRLERQLRQLADRVARTRIVPHAPAADLDRLPEIAELSPRQREILDRLVRGERVPGIARRLFLSQSTVRNHLSAIFRRLGVGSQEELLELLRR